MRRSTLWRPLFYLALVAAALVFTAESFDGTEVRALVAIAAASILCEAAGEFFGRRRRRAKVVVDVTGAEAVREQLRAMELELVELRSHRTTLGAECAGPYSVTVFVCNGQRVEVETCSPEGTSLEDHLATHTERVLARAQELGCR